VRVLLAVKFREWTFPVVIIVVGQLGGAHNL